MGTEQTLIINNSDEDKLWAEYKKTKIPSINDDVWDFLCSFVAS